jgi:short-subunit dehydrogenase
MPWSGSVVSTSGVLETNFFGYVHGARAVLPHFPRQGHGVLINNASAYSHVGAPRLTAYVSSKFAVRGFSEALRQGRGSGWSSSQPVGQRPPAEALH